MINDILAFWNGGYVNEWRYLLAIPVCVGIGFVWGWMKGRESMQPKYTKEFLDSIKDLKD